MKPKRIQGKAGSIPMTHNPLAREVERLPWERGYGKGTKSWRQGSPMPSGVGFFLENGLSPSIVLINSKIFGSRPFSRKNGVRRKKQA